MGKEKYNPANISEVANKKEAKKLKKYFTKEIKKIRSEAIQLTVMDTPKLKELYERLEKYKNVLNTIQPAKDEDYFEKNIREPMNSQLSDILSDLERAIKISENTVKEYEEKNFASANSKNEKNTKSRQTEKDSE